MNFVKNVVTVRSAIAALLLAGGVCGAALAQPSPQPSAPPPAQSGAPAKSGQPSDPGDKMICKYYDETGTRLGRHKECRTKREWDQMARDGGDLVDDAVRRH